MSIESQLFKSRLSEYLNCEPDTLSLYWKGRVGLYGLLKSLGVNEGDEVILPAYTCVVVPNAIKYLKAKPIYIDVDPKTYNIDPTLIESSITEKTKIIIAQNTYGLSSDIDTIKVIADKYKLKIIEDCTHGFGGKYKDVFNGKNVDAAFFSSQWNKAFSTGIGGIVITTDDSIKHSINSFEESLNAPSFKDRAVLKLQLKLRDFLGYSSMYWSALKFYRFLTSNNIIVGSSAGEEITGVKIPNNYFIGCSDIQSKRGVLELDRINENLAHRKRIAKKYDEQLQRLGLATPFQPAYAEHTFIKYPILVKNRTYVFSEAFKRNIPIHDWFISPIHPIEKDYHLWDFDPTQFPVANKISQHVINLPTDLFVNNSMEEKVMKLIEDLRNQFISFNHLSKI